tara:strand:- start:327 stop:554 length:228 start_codon:yes stop_codon:yes gene_type:complete
MSNPFCSNANSEKFCYPEQLTDFIIALIMPPLYVVIHEYRKGFTDPLNIFKNLILTSMFYFPGFMHAMYLANNDT